MEEEEKMPSASSAAATAAKPVSFTTSLDPVNPVGFLEKVFDFITKESDFPAKMNDSDEFNIERLQLVEAENKKIKLEYEKKEKQVEVRKKIEYSMQLNVSRIKVLQAQDDVVNEMKESTSKELLNVSCDYLMYKNLLKYVIVQSLVRLKEPAILLRCRKDDVHLVVSVLDSAKGEYASKVNVDPLKIFIDDVHLPLHLLTITLMVLFCSGGIVLASQDGKIVYENMLDARLDVALKIL
ncbi:V-type proton ATPase subunit E [Hibiscus syriacus]|uniref:V-type proton ATPase subunit E n=1 Tax=Hibiscus syriacus TaxID=106335 RepID=A0A6A2XCN1_HIBSY|nr:V-type proton ATPase subunit E [Hibiscus syriacus]